MLSPNPSGCCGGGVVTSCSDASTLAVTGDLTGTLSVGSSGEWSGSVEGCPAATLVGMIINCVDGEYSANLSGMCNDELFPWSLEQGDGVVTVNDTSPLSLTVTFDTGCCSLSVNVNAEQG